MWRFVDTKKLSASENIALDEILLKRVSKKTSPNTIRVLQFSPPAVLIGFHQSVEEEVRVSFCQTNGIDINRRITGGGAIYFDESQIGWEIIASKDAFGIKIAQENFFNLMCQPIIHFLKSIGIKAEFRPKNDIEVKGRKISGTGGTEEGNAFLFQGTLLTDFDVETMLHSLKVPIEKLKHKEKQSVKERVTWISREIKHPPSIEQIKRGIKKSFEQVFNIKLIESDILPDEREELKNSLHYYKSNDWIYKVKPYGRKNLYSIYKTKGGLIKTSIALDTKRCRIENIFITGDFFVYPKRAIFDLEASIKGIIATKQNIENTVREFFKKNKPKFPGIKQHHIINAIQETVNKANLLKYGFNYKEINRIFTVNAEFEEVIKSNPTYFLAPYCAKPIKCSFRYKRECVKCGKCSVGSAYEIAEKKGLKPITILSFEDLMRTLNKLRKQGVQSYIGCCCEAFYRKHRSDFEKSKLLAILIDIDNKTCYDLGKHLEAYEGKFESETSLNIDLFNKVLSLV